VKVLATRALPGSAWQELGDVELGVVQEPRPDIEILVAASETVDARLLDLLPSLKLVANYGVGYDRVDVSACTERGIAVTNTPGAVDAATADMALALLLAARRRLVEGDRLVRRGGWQTTWAAAPFLAHDVSGITLGLVGFGRVGKAFARRARAFDMRVLYTARSRRDTDLAEYRLLDELLAECDAVSLHTPLTSETTGLIDARRLSLLRDGATLVNTARGGVVDEPALVRELVSGRISAGLDVYVDEPRVPRELLGLPNVVLSPHLGTATIETRAAMTRILVDNILAFANGKRLPNRVA
jgi:glyoxylate reductase